MRQPHDPIWKQFLRPIVGIVTWYPVGLAVFFYLSWAYIQQDVVPVHSIYITLGLVIIVMIPWILLMMRILRWLEPPDPIILVDTSWPPTCPDCGYDLRATPDRCPECGKDVTQA